MIARRLSLRPDTSASHRLPPPAWRVQAADAGWGRKTLAVAMHFICLGLFGLIVVWPVASPLASGQLAREFKPELEALATWVALRAGKP